jgi:hypothetical protein
VVRIVAVASALGAIYTLSADVDAAWRIIAVLAAVVTTAVGIMDWIGPARPGSVTIRRQGHQSSHASPVARRGVSGAARDLTSVLPVPRGADFLMTTRGGR